MPSWTHLIRFVAEEDNQTHLGQLVDTSRDVGLDSFEGRKIQAYLINGSIFSGEVTKHILTVKQVSICPAIFKEAYLNPRYSCFHPSAGKTAITYGALV
jgi:hypothetical protein